ncbi:hypothetical protein PAHAL_2G254200 [Panicum hallii]|uniref:AB hydrolase-1 domain-containing protein n=1 Tax=Panicum hallii TaxID=206008 RepID=A0A2S3GZB2_9POAL|nr:hypothetical protein PAHAL_2G254200 [Panicum hallii]
MRRRRRRCRHGNELLGAQGHAASLPRAGGGEEEGGSEARQQQARRRSPPRLRGRRHPHVGAPGRCPRQALRRYVPDLLFFGGSALPAGGGGGRSPAFQADCVAAALRRLGVGRCAVVGFSYGGFVAFRMAEAHPGLVASVVVTGSLADMTCSTSERMLRRLGAASFAELLLPGDVAGLRSLFAAGTHRKWWFPDFVLKDYLELMMFNRKERAELLEGMVISDEDAAAPSFRQDILLLWGENDSIFTVELASKLKEQLGERAALRSVREAGHLVMLERPRAFNRCLREFLLLQQQPRTTTTAMAASKAGL